MSTITKQQIRQDLYLIIAKLVSLDPKDIKDESRLREDLGLDSLQSMELLSRISDKYELDIEVEEAMNILTVSDIVDKLAQMMSSRKPS